MTRARCCIDGICTMPAAPWHGTNNGYSSRGCRCEPCRDAHREKLRGEPYYPRRKRAAAVRPPAVPPAADLPALPPAVMRTVTSGTRTFTVCGGCGCWTARTVPDCRCTCHTPAC